MQPIAWESQLTGGVPVCLGQQLQSFVEPSTHLPYPLLGHLTCICSSTHWPRPLLGLMMTSTRRETGCPPWHDSRCSSDTAACASASELHAHSQLCLSTLRAAAGWWTAEWGQAAGAVCSKCPWVAEAQPVTSRGSPKSCPHKLKALSGIPESVSTTKQTSHHSELSQQQSHPPTDVIHLLSCCSAHDGCNSSV